MKITATMEDGVLVFRVPVKILVVEPNSDVSLLLNHSERQVLLLIQRGLQHKEIAATLNISTSAVKKRVTRVFLKLNCKSRAELLFKYPSQPEAKTCS